MSDYFSLFKHIYKEGLVTEEVFIWIHLFEPSLEPDSGKGMEIT